MQLNLITPKEIQTQRISICIECPKIRVIPIVGSQCTACGCLIKPKVAINGSTCPLKKW